MISEATGSLKPTSTRAWQKGRKGAGSAWIPKDRPIMVRGHQLLPARPALATVYRTWVKSHKLPALPDPLAEHPAGRVGVTLFPSSLPLQPLCHYSYLWMEAGQMLSQCRRWRPLLGPHPRRVLIRHCCPDTAPEAWGRPCELWEERLADRDPLIPGRTEQSSLCQGPF